MRSCCGPRGAPAACPALRQSPFSPASYKSRGRGSRNKRSGSGTCQAVLAVGKREGWGLGPPHLCEVCRVAKVGRIICTRCEDALLLCLAVFAGFEHQDSSPMCSHNHQPLPGGRATQGGCRVAFGHSLPSLECLRLHAAPMGTRHRQRAALTGDHQVDRRLRALHAQDRRICCSAFHTNR